MNKSIFLLIPIVLFIAKVFSFERKKTKKLKNKTNKKLFKFFDNIPNVIYRTIDNKNVTRSMFTSCHQRWLNLNPSFNMAWYTNKDCERFMSKFYPGSILDAYNKLKPGAYKADLWRLCILYKFGGVYADAYATPHVSIRQMIKNIRTKKNETFISVLDPEQSGSGIHNGFIISSPRHPFLKNAIKTIVKNVKNNYYGDSSLSITGPICLSKSILEITKESGHNIGYNNGYYLYDFHYGPYQNIFKNSTKIMSKYYSFLHYLYRKNVRKDGYHLMWKNRDVYRNQ